MGSAVLPFFLMSAAFCLAQDFATHTIEAPTNLTIPVQLSKSITTGKVHQGDKVEFRSVEPVLIGQGLVMPANAKLHGRVLGASSQQADKPAWLLLMVEDAKWKEHTLPLHAFIVAQITETAKQHSTYQPMEKPTISTAPPRMGRGRTLTPDQINSNVRYGGDLSLNSPHRPDSSSDTPKASHAKLEDVLLTRDKNGVTYLVSKKHELKLPAGVLLMLQQLKPPAVTAGKSPE